ELAGFERECGLFEIRHGLAPHDPAQLATLLLRARVIGVLFRELRKVSAMLQLLQDILGLCFELRRVFFWSTLCLDQDMAHHHALGSAIGVDVISKLLLKLRVRDLCTLYEIGGCTNDQIETPLLRN